MVGGWCILRRERGRMNMAKICREICWVRVNNRTTDLFEGL